MPKIIENISLISVGPARGHVDKESNKPVVVDPTTIDQVFAEATKLATLKVRVDHGAGVIETAGFVRDFVREGDRRVLGTLEFYDSYAGADLLCEIAQKNPSHLGISLEFGGADEEANDVVLARCGEGKLFAAAIVSDPAANKSLFSALLPDVKSLTAITPPNFMPTETTPTEQPKSGAVADVSALTTQLTSVMEKLLSIETRLSACEGIQPADQNKMSADQSKMSDDNAKKIAEYAAKETIKMFSAQFGAVTLPAAGTPAASIAKEDPIKLFAAKVDELAVKEFSNDRVRAMAAAMRRFPSEYSATRQIATK